MERINPSQQKTGRRSGVLSTVNGALAPRIRCAAMYGRPGQPFTERLELLLGLAQPAVELFGGLRSVCWALWLITHPELFHRYPAFFAPMAAVAPPWAWGLVVLTFGACSLGALFYQRRQGRRNAALLACMGWSGLAFMYARGDPGSLGIPLLICDALAAGWAYLRLGDDYGRGRDGRAE